MKYYKAMNKDFTCKKFQYEIGKTYELPKDTEMKIHYSGFHFCDILNACFNYYYKNNSIICEVEPLGKVDRDISESILVTDKIKIVRQLSDEEIEEQRYIIQDGIEMIGTGCFDHSDLREIKIPESVTIIQTGSFAGCELLNKVTIPKSVSVLRWGCFEECINLEEVIFTNNVDYVYYDVFHSCDNLKKIYVPKEFNKDVFNECIINNFTPLLSRVKVVEY